ncbi:hypothetical protein J2Z60_000883 [Lactobacillus colini]|uniref:Phage transcriptional regulator, ArpU family n=1 Tax=Lactobacillus colini TaxID=1819254 RepID=A0ABS4MDE7_9LACO|nr:hypothetical protein [Lactobacillus colini]MBP2057711.1 hypothetical protein [Lactobacillus colini]
MQNIATIEINKKETIRNTLDFINNKLPRLANFKNLKGINYTGVKVTNTPKEDAATNYFLMIKEANEQYESAIDAVNLCTDTQSKPYKRILKSEINNISLRNKIVNSGYEQSAYYKKRKEALLEFADRFLICQVARNLENIIDLHAYKN